MFRFFKDLSLEKKARLGYFLDVLGVSLIGLVCLGYITFNRNFAKLHIQIPFLEFPIFVGEILLSVCLLFLIAKWLSNRSKFSFWHYFVFLYLAFILIKAFSGYFYWGPLAFRHAALFYYPLFAVIGYSFYRRSFFSELKTVLLIFALILITRVSFFYDYFMLTCLILALLLIRSCPSKVLRYSFYILLLAATPYARFFYTSRTMLASNIVAGIYIGISLLFVLKVKRAYKLTVLAVIMIVLMTGLAKRMEDKNVRNALNFSFLSKEYKQHAAIITEREKYNDPLMQIMIDKVTADSAAKLYNAEPVISEDPKTIIVELRKEIAQEQERLEEAYEEIAMLQAEDLGKQPTVKKKVRLETLQKIIEEGEKKTKQIKQQLEETYLTKKKAESNIPGRIANLFFRYFIWQDMLKELRSEKPILGFAFGKPFRSRNIELLYWAVGDWSRDGWIAAHNSYLEIIYRAGILGILFILIIFSLLLKAINKSIRVKSVSGVLILGVIVNWLVASGFMVILELPYTAIPFWSLFGISQAYLFKEEFISN